MVNEVLLKFKNKLQCIHVILKHVNFITSLIIMCTNYEVLRKFTLKATSYYV